MGIVTVVVQFHEPVTIRDYGSRKALAEHCHRVVAAGVADALGKVGLPARAAFASAGRKPPAVQRTPAGASGEVDR